MMKNKIKDAGYFLDGKLRSLCGEITPDKRMTVVIVLLLVFALINLYITFSSVYNFGKSAAQKQAIEIKHMAVPQVVKPTHKKSNNDR